MYMNFLEFMNNGNQSFFFLCIKVCQVLQEVLNISSSSEETRVFQHLPVADELTGEKTFSIIKSLQLLY